MLSLAKILRKISAILANISEKIKPAPEVEGMEITEGQVVKVNKTGNLIANDNLKAVMAAGGTAEMTKLGTSPVSLKDVFATWQRISCTETTGADQNSTTIAAQVTARNCYSYDDATKSIVCPNNSDPFSAFISTDKFKPDYTIKYQLKGRDSDDDGLCFVCGYMVDKNGKFHTLTVWRVGDNETSAADPITDFSKSSHGMRLAIGYDVYVAWTGKISGGGLILARSIAPKKTAWNTNTCLCQVTKTTNKITALTADVNSTDMKYKLEWTLPSSKPSGWTQEQYDNIKYMMQNPSNIGFGTQSNPCSFTIQSQEGSISDVTVYDIDTGKKVVYRNGAKQSEVVDEGVMSPGAFIYSVSTKKLFYVRSRGNIIPITLN